VEQQPTVGSGGIGCSPPVTGGLLKRAARPEQRYATYSCGWVHHRFRPTHSSVVGAAPRRAAPRRDIDDAQTRKADSRREYQVDTLVLWDGGPPNLRVMVTVDDGGWSAFWATVKASFIKAPDGSFVGE
jgi:hypothetical protein